MTLHQQLNYNRAMKEKLAKENSAQLFAEKEKEIPSWIIITLRKACEKLNVKLY